MIKLSNFRMEDSGHYMPVLPRKRNLGSGNKKCGDELQCELVEYMRDLIRIPKVQRMLYVRMFLSINSYASISEETFKEMGTYEGLASPMG